MAFFPANYSRISSSRKLHNLLVSIPHVLHEWMQRAASDPAQQNSVNSVVFFRCRKPSPGGRFTVPLFCFQELYLNKFGCTQWNGKNNDQSLIKYLLNAVFGDEIHNYVNMTGSYGKICLLATEVFSVIKGNFLCTYPGSGSKQMNAILVQKPFLCLSFWTSILKISKWLYAGLNVAVFRSGPPDGETWFWILLVSEFVLYYLEWCRRC